MKHKMFLFAVVVLLSTAKLLSQLSLEVVWEKPQAGVIDAKFSPDGKFIYCAIGADIKKLDVATGEFVATFNKGELTDKNIYLEISPDGKTIITGNTTGKGGLYLWDTELEKVIREFKVDGISENQELYLASFSQDSRHILLTLYTRYQYPKSPTNEILLFDLVENKVVKKVPFERIEQIQYSKDGKYFITGTAYEQYPRITLWDAKEMTVIREYTDLGTDDNGFRKIQLSDNNKLIGLATHNSNIVKILETETGKVVKTSDDGTTSTNFNLLPNDYYLIYQWRGDGTVDYGLNIYKYPDIFQSSVQRYGSNVIISKSIQNDDGDEKILVFQSSMALLANSTTNVNEPVNHEYVITVEPEKISINFDNADSIKIIDINGNILLDKVVSGNSTSIPNTYSPGTYICVVKSGNREYSQKFQVVR
ncbi:MAG: T9SS type A sorting domain-containing protein [Ignavibacteriae bacterium]|nr:T9SS type A sorting domain-containing protein [Ignavibacteriota bacterium]